MKLKKPYVSNAQLKRRITKWEKDGNNLYWEMTVTTPNYFLSAPGELSGVEFVAYNHLGDGLFLGSMAVTYNAENFPYGTQVYHGIIDLTDFDKDWTTIQAGFGYVEGTPLDHHEVWYTDMIMVDEW